MANTQSNLLVAERLVQQFTELAGQYKIKTWCLAYSGGVDSQVLLHLLQQTRLNVTAVYIDHGLQAESADWAEHCEQQCEQFNIPFQTIKVNALPAKGESPEAAARAARYGAFKKIIHKKCCLLTAQHQDDQAETVLLQLLRGAGAAGLSAMPEISAFSQGWHARPLLDFSQKSILDYAQKHQLSWVEDPSNQQTNYDRNYLRHSVIPDIQQRWPALNKTLSVFAEQQAENTGLLDELAAIDLETVVQKNDYVDITQLKKLNNARIRNVLRFWFKSLQSPLPSRAVLQQIVQQMQVSSNDNNVLVSWANMEVRRFRDRLYCAKKMSHDASQVLLWDAKSALPLTSIEKQICLQKKTTDESTAFVLDSKILSFSLSVRFRQGGEKIRPVGRDGHHDLKSLFQEADVPAWQRDKIPLLYADDKLIAVVGFCLADEFAVKGEGLLPVLI